MLPPSSSDPGARSAANDARSAKSEVEDLRGEMERLMLTTEALWRIVREKLNCTDAELVERIHDIDLEDGRLDGRKAISPARDCPHCGRKLVKHRLQCFYCGKPVALLPFER